MIDAHVRALNACRAAHAGGKAALPDGLGLATFAFTERADGERVLAFEATVPEHELVTVLQAWLQATADKRGLRGVSWHEGGRPRGLAG